MKTVASQPHRSHNRGSFVVDRIFRGVGRVRMASGTTNKVHFEKLNALLTDLYDDRRLEVIIALRDGHLDRMAMVALHKQGGLKAVYDAHAALASAEADRPIGSLWVDWVASTKNQNTQRMRALAWKHLETVLPEGARLADLPEAVKTLRKRMQATQATFNRMRACTQSFLSEIEDTEHPAYVATTRVKRLREMKSERAGLFIQSAIAIREALPEEFRGAWWTLITTGMRIGEYMEHDANTWTIEEGHVQVNGTKNKGSVRPVPLTVRPDRTRINLKTFRKALRVHKVTPHIARYTFKHILGEAGIPEARVEQYMGHELPGMKIYATVRLAEWIPGDRATFLRYLEAEEAKYVAAGPKSELACAD